jgi:hypothetical protein
MNYRKIYESVLKDNAVFYDFVYNELHEQKNVNIISVEKRREYSQFDYESERTGTDKVKDDGEFSKFGWINCTLTEDDDGLYWESKSGKKGCLLIYGIKKVILEKGKITLFLQKTEGRGEEGKVIFITSQKYS